jgi:TonB family protein
VSAGERCRQRRGARHAILPMRGLRAIDGERVGSRIRMPQRPRFAGVKLVICLLYGLTAGYAQTASESQVKAAYLYNFAKSAEWPEQSLASGAPLVIGVVDGDDEFVDVLSRTVAGKTIKGHAVLTKRVSGDEEIKTCHLVFVRDSAGRRRTLTLIAAQGSAGILWVGEDDAFLREGGMINLVLAKGKIRFEVESASLERANIHLGADLLALALAGSGSSDGAAGDSRRLKVSAPAEYPEIAQRMGIKGSVQLELTVGRDGAVKDVRVIGGHPLLTEAAAKAVKGWVYEPAVKESKIVVKLPFGQ